MLQKLIGLLLDLWVIRRFCEPGRQVACLLDFVLPKIKFGYPHRVSLIAGAIF